MHTLVRQKVSLQLLSFYLLFVIPVLLGGLGLYVFQRTTLEQSALQSDQGLAQAVALAVGAKVQAASELAVELSTSESTRTVNAAQLDAQFSSAFGAHPDVTLYFLLDPTGNMIYTYPTDTAAVGRAFGQRDSFLGALHGSAPYVSSRRTSDITHTQVFTVTVSMRNPAGRLIGVLGLNVSLDIFTLHLQAIQHQLSPGSGLGIWVIDHRGQTVATTRGDPIAQGLPDLPRPLAASVQQGAVGSLTSSQQNKRWFYSFVPVPEANWSVVVQRPADETLAIVTEFEHGLIVALVVLLAGAAFFWFAMRWRIIAPLTRLAHAVACVQADQLNEDVPATATLLPHDQRRLDEIGMLVTAFIGMEKHIRLHVQQSDETIRTQFHTLDAILSSMREGMLLQSPSGQVVYANPVFCRAVGIPAAELHGATMHSDRVRERLIAMLASAPLYEEVFETPTGAREPHSKEFQLHGTYRGRDRFIPTRRDIRVRVFHVRDASGRLMGRGRIFQDVTLEHEAERIKSNLLATVSHELRTPLTAIKGYATGLLDDAGSEPDPHWHHHGLKQIVEESDRLADLVTSLLDMSQIEAGTLQLLPEHYALQTLITEAVEQAFAPPERDAMLVQLPDGLPLLKVDRRRIVVVFHNLLENALRHGGPEPRVEIIGATDTDETSGLSSLTVTISDHGPGIPPDLTERVFDRFFQIDPGRHHPRNSVGLGLAICRGFMEAHGGHIWATSRSDGTNGAVFHMQFPPGVLSACPPQLIDG